MQLVEKLKYHIQKLQEDYHYAVINNQTVEYMINPTSRELQNFMKDYKKVRCINDDNDWYFWPAEKCIHSQFTQKVLGYVIHDYFDTLADHIYQIEIDQFGITYAIFETFVQYIEAEEWDIFENPTGKKYFEDFAKAIKFLQTKYSLKLTNKAMRIWKDIQTGAAWE